MFVFSVSLQTPSGADLVSCGEDGSVMVWQGTEPLQSIPHPSCVWCAVALPHDQAGDFITCADDGYMRLFSRDPSRIAAADPSLQDAFVTRCAEAKARKNPGPSAEDIAKAPSWMSAGSLVGSSDGQVYLDI